MTVWLIHEKVIVRRIFMANSSNEKVYNVLAYIGILFIVGLIADSQNPKVRFHVNQGLVLFLAEVVLGIVCGIISAIPFIGFIGSICSGIIGIVGVVFMIIGIIHAANDEEVPLPVIGGIIILK